MLKDLISFVEGYSAVVRFLGASQDPKGGEAPSEECWGSMLTAQLDAIHFAKSTAVPLYPRGFGSILSEKDAALPWPQDGAGEESCIDKSWPAVGQTELREQGIQERPWICDEWREGDELLTS